LGTSPALLEVDRRPKRKAQKLERAEKYKQEKGEKWEDNLGGKMQQDRGEAALSRAVQTKTNKARRAGEVPR